MRYGARDAHERVLDFRTGTLRRSTDWTSPTGRRVRIASERLVSFTQRAVAAIHYEVEPLDGDAAAGRPVRPVGQRADRVRHRATRASPPRCRRRWSPTSPRPTTTARCWRTTPASPGCGWPPAMDHEIDVADGPAHRDRGRGETSPGSRSRSTCRQGERLRSPSISRYGWSAQRSTPALRAQVEAALAGARQTGWEGLLDEQRAFLDDFWDTADVEIEGDPELQQAVRFALFHVLQAGARGETPGDPGQGPDRPRLRRARVLGHRDVRPARAHLHRARRGPRRAAVAALHAGQGPRPGRPARAGAARRSRGGRSTARSARLLAGRHRRVPRRRRHRRRDRPLPRGHRGQGLRARLRHRAAGRDRPAVGARSATTTRTRASASTASPDRTSTPRSPTTTSTRT